jgi:hypothetical protein
VRHRVHSAVTFALASLAACAPFRGSPRHPPVPPLPLSLDSLARIGFVVHATNSGVRPSPTPIAVQATVVIVNTAVTRDTASAERPRGDTAARPPAKGDTLVRVMGGNCAVLLRFYRRPDRTGKPVLDTSGPGVECFGPVLRRRIASGDSTRLLSPRDGPDTELPPGRYWLSALVTWITTDGTRRTEVPAGEVVVRGLPYGAPP